MSTEKRRKIEITVKGKKKTKEISARKYNELLGITPMFDTKALAERLQFDHENLVIALESLNQMGKTLTIEEINRTIETSKVLMDSGHHVCLIIPNFSLGGGFDQAVTEAKKIVEIPSGINLDTLDYSKMTDQAINQKYGKEVRIKIPNGTLYHPKFITMALLAIKKWGVVSTVEMRTHSELMPMLIKSSVASFLIAPTAEEESDRFSTISVEEYFQLGART
jgi:hypothetical protein